MAFERECPDNGACHHHCTRGCFRVATCEPLSGVFEGDVWPAEIEDTMRDYEVGPESDVPVLEHLLDKARGPILDSGRGK